MKQENNRPMQRYARQMILPQVGGVGQLRLSKSRVLIVGCGGLGCVVSQILVRSGVGEITLCDNEKIELENLHRQILFNESHIGRLKAEVAADQLRAMNSQVEIHVVTDRVDQTNVDDRIAWGDLIVDATDNLESRYLLNASAAANGRDWIYGGCVGTEGTVAVIRSRTGGCLECLFGPNPVPPPDSTAPFPVLPPTPMVVGAIQAQEALRYLLTDDHQRPCDSRVISIDLWQGRVRSTAVAAGNPDCRICAQYRRD